jgi:hypothetical protein
MPFTTKKIQSTDPNNFGGLWDRIKKALGKRVCRPACMQSQTALSINFEF